MKNSLFIFLVFISFNQLKAQELGSTFFGGNFSFALESIDSETQDESEIQLSINPVIGKMVSDKIALGVAFGFIYSKYDDNSQYGYSGDSKALAIAPFIRIHNNITENFKYYITPNFGKTFVLGDKSDNKTQIYNVGINVGLLYFISQKMSVELNIAGINYIHMSDKDYDMKSNNVSLDCNLSSPNIGLKYYF